VSYPRQHITRQYKTTTNKYKLHNSLTTNYTNNQTRTEKHGQKSNISNRDQTEIIRNHHPPFWTYQNNCIYIILTTISFSTHPGYYPLLPPGGITSTTNAKKKKGTTELQNRKPPIYVCQNHWILNNEILLTHSFSHLDPKPLRTDTFCVLRKQIKRILLQTGQVQVRRRVPLVRGWKNLNAVLRRIPFFSVLFFFFFFQLSISFSDSWSESHWGLKRIRMMALSERNHHPHPINHHPSPKVRSGLQSHKSYVHIGQHAFLRPLSPLGV